MRSHYDAKTSPLSISQQTSNSAVRDMALRRGQPHVIIDNLTYAGSSYEASPISPMAEPERRKSKPARLDLSKLFPKPRAGDGRDYSGALLSPNKMVNSPAPMSSTRSEFLAQPMSREPTPAPKARAKLTKHATRRHAENAPSAPDSPKRLFKRDEYDNTKVHVRRPPKGVQHWFDALDDDSDDVPEDTRTSPHDSQLQGPNPALRVPARKSSNKAFHASISSALAAPKTYESVPGFSVDTFSHEDMIDIKGLTSPSQYSLQTQNSTKTKESTMSKHNLQDSSCLSFSSSEDEREDERQGPRKFAVRKSLIMDDDAGDIVFGQAQAFEVRSSRNSERKMSIMSTSTSAATIDIMYTPEPFSPPTFPRVSNHSGSRRSSHLRQPSVILEDEDDRPRTARHAPPSSSAYSIRSTRTSASEPQPHSRALARKMMSVTPEEEALLELMRKKRASMEKHSSNGMSRVYTEHEDQRQKALDALQTSSRTSTFSGMDAPMASPIRVVEMKSKRKSMAPSSATLTPPPRGRSARTNHDANMSSHLRESPQSDSDSFSLPITRDSLPHHIPSPGAFSPLDPFPPMSPFNADSIASPTTFDHVSPLPSPVTPGVRFDGPRDTVKIASSDTSADGDEASALDNELPIHIIKAARSFDAMDSSHQRRRTASSGTADMAFPIPPSYGAKDLAPVSEASVSSRAPSIIEPAMPQSAAPERKAMRKSAIALAWEHRSNRGSVVSDASSHSSPSSLDVPTYNAGRERSRHASRGSSVASMGRSRPRNSVSDDVLAAWGSLGGTY